MSSRKYTSVVAFLQEMWPDCENLEYATLDSLGIDSFGFIELVLRLESAFGIDFDEEMLIPEQYSTMQSIALYVESRAASLGEGNE